MGWYEDMDVNVSHACSDSDPRKITVSVTLKSDAPSNARKLPVYVTGTGQDRPPRAHRLPAVRLRTAGSQDHRISTHEGTEAG